MGGKSAGVGVVATGDFTISPQSSSSSSEGALVGADSAIETVGLLMFHRSARTERSEVSDRGDMFGCGATSRIDFARWLIDDGSMGMFRSGRVTAVVVDARVWFAWPERREVRSTDAEGLSILGIVAVESGLIAVGEDVERTLGLSNLHGSFDAIGDELQLNCAPDDSATGGCVCSLASLPVEDIDDWF